jgi:hypothetical protein
VLAALCAEKRKAVPHLFYFFAKSAKKFRIFYF